MLVKKGEKAWQQHFGLLMSNHNFETEVTFVYQDVRGNITCRTVLNISEADDYIQGYCHKAKALRTFRKDRILEEFVGELNKSFVEERLLHHIKINPSASPKVSARSHHLLDMCFTGFKTDDKKRLTKLAKEAGIVVRSSVTRSLNYLCCGYNAGPVKVEKARKQGAISLSENQFVSMLETGEIPEA